MSTGALASRTALTSTAPSASRQALTGLAVGVGAAGLTAVVVTRPTLSAAAVLLVVGGSLWFATTRRTPLALALLMLYLGLLDGYLKLATGSNVVTFVRDVLLYAIVVGLLVRAAVQHTRLAVPPLTAWVVAFGVIVFVELANPHAGTLVHSLAGVRQHLEFVPLFFLAFAFLRTTRALRGFVILLAVIAAANGVAGLVQFNETPQQFASWGPGYAERILGLGIFAGSGRTFAATPGGASAGTRPFGLGSDTGDGGLFGAVALSGILAIASLRRGGARYLLFVLPLAAGATLAIITSQDRGVIVGAVIMVLAFASLTATTRNRTTNLLGLALAAVVTLLVVQVFIGSVGSSSVRYQALNPSSLITTTNAARGRSIALIPHNLITYPFGAGLGTAGPASESAPGGSPVVGTVDTETEFSFLTIETGIPGMLVLTGFTIALLVLGFRRCRHEPDREARVLLAAVVAPLAGILALFLISDPSVSVPTGPYLWAAGGIISYWLVALPAARRRQASRPTGALELASVHVPQVR